VNTSKRRILSGAIALTFVAAACGSDDATSSDSTAASADGTTAESAPADTADSTAPAESAAPADTSASTDGGATAAPVSGTLIGAGSSAQAAAMQGWQAGFQTANPDATVEYDPVGSGGGRETFLAGGSNFAGSDSPLNDEEFEASKSVCGDLGAINLPHYISPIAIAYNLPGVDELNLSPEVIAGIFTNAITSWDDPAIAADNPDATLPSTTINPVHRSDKSGTTKNFTDYMSQTAPDVWTFEALEEWDADGPGGGEGAAQTSGMVAAITAGEGSIGYADESQIGDLPAASVGVGEEFVAPSAEAAAALVDVSERVTGRSEFDFSYKLVRDTDDATVYPVTLVSYHIVCLQYDDQATVDLVKAFMSYVGSSEGQQAAAESAGSAPISPDTAAQLEKAVAAIDVAG
jgi:phosphate transport system substrate-binding protein